jgi:hypothetical protein
MKDEPVARDRQIETSLVLGWRAGIIKGTILAKLMKLDVDHAEPGKSRDCVRRWYAEIQDHA